MAAPTTPLLLSPRYGVAIHHGRTQFKGREAVTYSPDRCYSLWCLERGRMVLRNGQTLRRLAGPVAVLLPPDPAWRIEAAAAAQWLRAMFDVMRVPLRRGQGPGTWDHRRPARQPPPTAVWGQDLEPVVPADLTASCRAMLSFVCAIWWRSELDWGRANARLGAWLIEYVAWHRDHASLVDGEPGRRTALVAARLSRGLRVGDLAHDAGYGRQHFTIRFKAEHGCTPGRWLAEQRLDRACRLLRETDQSVRGVADHVGFLSPAAFCHFFKHHTGLSPAAWRRTGR
jgi:AraC-like DNA-binding protein